MNFLQTIVLPERVSNDIFNLPCVDCILKYQGKPVYQVAGVCTLQLRMVTNAMPGDILAECHDHRWWLLSQEEYLCYLRTAGAQHESPFPSHPIHTSNTKP